MITNDLALLVFNVFFEISFFENLPIQNFQLCSKFKMKFMTFYLMYQKQ